MAGRLATDVHHLRYFDQDIHLLLPFAHIQRKASLAVLALWHHCILFSDQCPVFDHCLRAVSTLREVMESTYARQMHRSKSWREDRNLQWRHFHPDRLAFGDLTYRVSLGYEAQSQGQIWHLRLDGHGLLQWYLRYHPHCRIHAGRSDGQDSRFYLENDRPPDLGLAGECRWHNRSLYSVLEAALCKSSHFELFLVDQKQE